MIDNQELWDRWIQTMLFDFKNPSMRGANFDWNKVPELISNHVCHTAHIYYEDNFNDEFKEEVRQYIFDKVTLRIKNKDHLPEATRTWVLNLKNHSKPRTIENWLHETIEGNSAFDVARYAKEHDLVKRDYLQFISLCRDLPMKWLLISRTLSAINVDLLEYETSTVNYFYDIKPNQYTIDRDRTHHLGWFIELCIRSKNEELFDKLLLSLNVFFNVHIKDLIV